ncbi:hypothetical protein M3Y95_00911800 [Aphelenchoides besseyi]|nr:hypothetical protein M3Y95_00911800 [Aphelenchoides besseyi]
MERTNDDQCLQAYFYRTYTYINVAQYVQIALAILSLVFIFRLIRSEEFQRLRRVIGVNLKYLAFLGICVYVAGAVSSLSFYVYVTILNLMNLPECHYVWTVSNCYAFRLPMYYCVIGFNCFHLSLLVERLITTFGTRQKSTVGDVRRPSATSMFGSNRFIIGFMGITMVLLIPLAVTLWIFVIDSEDLTRTRTYCLAGSVSGGNRIAIVTYSMLVIDLCSLVGDVLLLIYNKRQLKQLYSNQNLSYNLQYRFTVHELQLSIWFIFPFTLIHSLAFSFYLLFFTFNRAYLSTLKEHEQFLMAEVNSSSKAIYIAVVPLALLLYHRFRAKKTKMFHKQEENADIYFELFQKQIR